MREPAPTLSGVPDLRLPGETASAVEAAAATARNERWTKRLFARDPSLWSADERVQSGISERLGWLDAPRHFADHVADLEAFGAGIRAAGFRQALVMGMGGSSLAPEVLAGTFGVADDGIPVSVL